MDISRKQFCARLGSGTVLLWLQACGGGGGYSSAPAPAPGSGGGTTCGASGAEIAGNHGHVLVIPAADLDSAMPMTYGIAGTAGHNHNVTFSPAQLQTLKTGGSVTVTSTMTTTTVTHDHVVTASCV